MGFPISRDDLIDALRRTTDPGWLDPLLEDPNSAAVLNSLAEILTRVASAAEQGCAQGLISQATGGAPGSSVVSVSRPSGSVGAVPKGTVFVDPRGVLAVTTVDIPVPAGAAALSLNVVTLRQNEIVNTVNDPDWRFGPSTQVADASNTNPIVIRTTTPHGLATGQTARITGVLGNLAANAINPIVVLTSTTFSLTGVVGTGTYTGGGVVQLSPMGLLVTSATPILGGTSDFLSAHGNERGTPRQPNEATYPYRLRVRNIPDAVSPVAISLAVQGPAQAVGADPVMVLESLDAGLSATVANRYSLGSINPLFASGTSPADGSPAVDFFDDPYRETVSAREATCYFRLEPRTLIPDPDTLRFFLDGLSFGDDPVFGYLDIIQHPAVISALMAIWNGANVKRAAGVQFDLELNEAVTLNSRGTTFSATSILVSTLTAPVGSSWMLIDMLAGHDTASSSPDSPVLPASMNHSVRFTFADASTYTTAVWTGYDTQLILPETLLPVLSYPSNRITKIETLAKSDGFYVVGANLTVRVLEIKD